MKWERKKMKTSHLKGVGVRAKKHWHSVRDGWVDLLHTQIYYYEQFEFKFFSTKHISVMWMFFFFQIAFTVSLFIFQM